jgi:hypothetical protein
VQRITGYPGLVLATCWLLAGCEPSSITEARNQLGRGPARVTTFAIPIAQDTVTLGDFLSDDTTSIGGLVALKFDPDSVNVDVGNRLQFNNINLTQFTAPDISPLAPEWAGGGTITVPAVSYSVLSSETRLNAVDTIVVETGSLTITTNNRLQGTLNYTLTLNGFKNAAGVTLSQSSTVPAGNGTGGYGSSSITFNLAGVSITPATVNATISGSVVLPPGSNPATGVAPVTQDGTGSMVVRSLAGLLSSAQTPELAVTVENSRELPSSAVDFGDFEDAVTSSTLNNASANLTIINTAQTPVVLSNFRLGAVRCVGSTNPCQLQRDGSGNLVYEKDGANNPILVTVADPGQTTLTIGRAATKTVALPSAALVDRVAHLLIANPPTRLAMVTTGTATIGDGAKSKILRTDFIKVRFQMVVGMDITIPAAGVLFTQTQIGNGLDLSTDDADDVAAHLSQASVSATVTNSTPFGVVAQLVLAKDSLAPTVDIFTLATRVTLDSVVLPAPAVNASGVVVTPTTATASLVLSGANARLLFNKKFTAGIRIRLLPGTGGSPPGRGAISTTDRVIFNAKAQVQLTSGGRS